STPGRSGSGTGARVAFNSAANRTNRRAALRSAACHTLRLLRAGRARRRIAGIKTALADGPLITFVFIAVLLLLGLPLGWIYVRPVGLRGCAPCRNTNHKRSNDHLRVKSHQ